MKIVKYSVKRCLSYFAVGTKEKNRKYKELKLLFLLAMDEKISCYQKKYGFIFIFVIISLFIIYLLFYYPHYQVARFEINNSTNVAQLENSYRVTMAQIIGGAAVAFGTYVAWRNLITAHEGQITERFTNAIDQLGNPAIEIKLGGIYSLERISTESKKDYWPIMEILTAYIRKNSNAKNKKVIHISMDIQANESTTSEFPETSKVSFDIQAILTVIGNRIHSFNNGESTRLNLRRTHLEGADLREAHLEGADLRDAHLEGADLREAHLEGANLSDAHLEGANLSDAHLEGANLSDAHLNDAHLDGAHLEGANLIKAVLSDAYLERADLSDAHLNGAHLDGTHLEGANLIKTVLSDAHLEKAVLYFAHLEGAFLMNTHFEGADLMNANLEGAKNLLINQLLDVETLYETTFDKELRRSFKKEHPEKYEYLISYEPNPYE